MIAWAAARNSPRLAPVTSPLMTPPNFVASSGSPITPVDARKISEGLQPAVLAAICGGELGRGAAVLAGEGVGVAGIDDQRARLAGLHIGAAPFDRRRRAFRAREHAGHAGACLEQGQQHVGAAGIADAGGGRRQPHAVDCRHGGHVLGGEGRDGGGHSRRALSSPSLSRRSRLDWHGRAYISEMAGTSPAMTTFLNGLIAFISLPAASAFGASALGASAGL